VRPKYKALVTPIKIIDILSQKDSADAWRTGSPIVRIKPVPSMTPSAVQNHGENRCQTSTSGWSARTWPSTRSATISIDTNTMPIIVMWIVCNSGVSQSRD
jgi:hypothetical protein